MDRTTDEFFMREALKQAELAYEQEEVPVGAVVVASDRIISRAHNLTERLNDATAHAEMQALTAASHALLRNIFRIAPYLSPWSPASCARAPSLEPDRSGHFWGIRRKERLSFMEVIGAASQDRMDRWFARTGILGPIAELFSRPPQIKKPHKSGAFSPRSGPV